MKSKTIKNLSKKVLIGIVMMSLIFSWFPNLKINYATAATFEIGDTVKVSRKTSSADPCVWGTNVRNVPGGTEILNDIDYVEEASSCPGEDGYAPYGVQGKIIDGPSPNHEWGYTWWKVEFVSKNKTDKGDKKYIGWTIEKNLTKVIAESFPSATINSYSPKTKITVEQGESFPISVTFTNTGNIDANFYPGATIWDSNENEVFNNYGTKKYLSAGQQTTFSWNTTINVSGEYWLQFGAWNETKSNLLDKKPLSHSQNLINVIPPEEKPDSPILTSPSDNSHQNSSITFQWSSVSGASKYKLFVKLPNSSDWLSDETPNTSYPYSPTLIGEYHWKVKAYTNGKWSDYSEERTFYAENQPPFCTPGKKECVSTTSYKVCKSDGSGWNVYNCSNGYHCSSGNCVQQKCNDGTLYGKCSSAEPLYCNNGNLISKCSLCGCPTGQECETNGSCSIPPPENQPPTCSLSANQTSGEAPLDVIFLMNANDSDGSIISWELDVDNDGVSNYSGSGNPTGITKTYKYQNQGTYTARLTVVDDDGESGSCTTDIIVNPVKPLNCEIELQNDDGEKIDKINVGESFNIKFINYSGDIKQVRFLKDELQNGKVNEEFGGWTGGFDWNRSPFDWKKQEDWLNWWKRLLWDNSDKTLHYLSFDTLGDKEVWAEVSGGNNLPSTCSVNISIVDLLENQPPDNYAIIVAGGGKWYLPGDKHAIDNAANNTYRALRNLGFSDNHLFYLNSNRPQDIDGDKDQDGILDEIDADASFKNFNEAMMQVKQKINENDQFVLYLVGHGSRGKDDPTLFFFEFGNGDTLTPFTLDISLSYLPEETLKLIKIDACFSGIFITDPKGNVSADNRIIITASHDTGWWRERPVVTMPCSNNFFWRNLTEGLSVREAFVKDTMSVKRFDDRHYSWLDDNGDARGSGPKFLVEHPPMSEDDEGWFAANTKIGSITSPVLPLSEWEEKESDLLKKGDLLVAKLPNSPVPGYWSHVGIYVGEGWVVHASIDGIKKVSIEEWLSPKMTWVTYLRVMTGDDKTREKAVSFALDQIGKSFGWNWLLKQIEGESYYCSELAWAAYMHASNGLINISKHESDILGASFGVSPSEIVDDKNTLRIGGHFEKEPETIKEGIWKGFKKLIADLGSPGNLRVTDSQDRITGVDENGEIKEDIPNSFYDEESKTVVIFDPSSDVDAYHYEVVGIDDPDEDTYGLTITSVKDGEALAFTASDMPTAQDVIHTYTVDWKELKDSGGEKGVTMEIDADADGNPERKINTGKVLKQDDFLLAMGYSTAQETPWQEISTGISQDNGNENGMSVVTASPPIIIKNQPGNYNHSPVNVILEKAKGSTAICYTNELTDGKIPKCGPSCSCNIGNLIDIATDTIEIPINSTSYFYAVSCYSDGSNSKHTGGKYTISIPNGGGGSNSGSSSGYSSPIIPSTDDGQVNATPFGGGKTIKTNPDGSKTEINIPANALLKNTTISVEPKVKNAISPIIPLESIIGNYVYDLNAVAGTTPITNFQKPITITLTYLDSQVAGSDEDEQNLKIYYWDEDNSKWIALANSKVNTETNTITATVDHFTLFAIMGGKIKGAEIEILADGVLAREEGTFEVYVIKIIGDKKFKRHIVSGEIFNVYGHLDWDKIQEVPEGTLNDYSLSAWVRVCTGANGTPSATDKVYEINSDSTMHHLNMTAQQFYARGGSEPAIFNINQAELNLYTLGVDVMYQ